MDILFLLVGGAMPVLMICVGILYTRHGANDTQGVVRYRTYRSTMNKKTWKYAHKVCGKVCLSVGKGLLSIVFPLALVACQCSEQTVGHMISALLTLEILLYFGAIVFTEQALKRYIRHFSQSI